jgi:hypothetical protein
MAVAVMDCLILLQLLFSRRVFRKANACYRLFIAENQVLTFLAWLLLFIFCWPLAIVALLLWPIVWLISLPFRVVGITFEALFALLRAILFLPARALGFKSAA